MSLSTAVSKTSTLTAVAVITIPVLGIGLLTKKISKLKNEGKLTSVLSFLNSIPVIWRTKRYIFVEKKLKNNKHLKRLGNGKFNAMKPNFKLSDHWQCRDTDVLCAVLHKSGTTWCQQICHVLRTGGDEEVNYNQCLLDVTPWLERQLAEHFAPLDDKPIPPDPAAGPGATDMNADHIAPIRVFKSHLPYKAISDQKCKIIYFYRHDVDVIYSGYKFFCGGILEVLDKVTPHQYATLAIYQGILEKSLKNLCDYWEHRNDSNIGFFFFDDVKEDHKGSVIRIAKLMGIEPKTDLIDKTVEQSTVKFMSADDHFLRFDGFTVVSCFKRAVGLEFPYWPERSGIPPKGGPKGPIKVSKGGGQSSGSKKQKKIIPGRDEVQACFDKVWARIVLPRTGFASYADMRAAWNDELSKKAA